MFRRKSKGIAAVCSVQRAQLMLRPRVLVVSTLVGLAASLALPHAAEACSGGMCYGGFFLPADATTVPASLPSFVYQPRLDEASTTPFAAMELFLLDGGNEVKVDTTRLDESAVILLTPVSPLLPDRDYVVRGDNLCPSGTLVAKVHTGAAAPLPAALGTVIAGAPAVGPIQVSTTSGSCSATISAAQATLDLTLSADAAPFADALQVTTFVDGKPFRWSPSLLTEPPLGGKMHNVVFASCQSDDPSAEKGLAEGVHQVKMRGALRGSGLILETPPVEVTLSCGDAGGSGGGATTSGSGGGATTSGTGGSASSSSSGGGGCNIAGDASPGAWALSGLAAALAFARRRRSAPR